MTFFSLTPSVDIAKCKVSMLKLLKLYLYISFEKKANASVLFCRLIKNLQSKGKTEELET